MGCEGPHPHTAGNGGLQGARDLQAIEPENQDIDRLTGLFDRRDDGGDSGIWLNDEFHTYSSSVSNLLANRRPIVS
jgi:hypothetical protein